MVKCVHDTALRRNCERPPGRGHRDFPIPGKPAPQRAELSSGCSTARHKALLLAVTLAGPHWAGDREVTASHREGGKGGSAAVEVEEGWGSDPAELQGLGQQVA